jgi:hypothetical protein
MVATAVFGMFSGAVTLLREFTIEFHELYGPQEAAIGEYLRNYVPERSVILVSNNHRNPIGMLSGRPQLAGYDGWLWSHGYDYGERVRDRDLIFQCITKAEDDACYQRIRRWGIRYVVFENTHFHDPEAKAKGDAILHNTPPVPPIDTKQKPPASKQLKGPNSYLSNQVERIFTSGRFDVFIVHGYGFAPT